MNSVFIKIIFLLIFTVFAASPLFSEETVTTIGVDLKKCMSIFKSTNSFEKMSPSQKRFYKELFLPVVGARGAQYKVKIGKHSLEWLSYADSSLNYRVEFSDSKDAALKIEMRKASTGKQEKGTRFLTLPISGTYQKKEYAEALKRLFLGHPLHPQIVDSQNIEERITLDEPPFLLRNVQKQASDVLGTYIKKFDEGNSKYQKLLVVSTTGTGKSDMLLSGLQKLLATKTKLIVVTSARVNVVRDRAGEIEKLLEQGFEFEIVTWAGNSDSSISFDELLRKINNSDKPVILCTTLASLDSKDTKKNINKLRKLRGSILFDEAHHSAGPEIHEILQSLSSSTLSTPSKWSVYGFSATPLSTRGSIQEVYDNHAFWTYVDVPSDFFKKPQPVERDVRTVATQLELAIQSGDVTGFDKVHFINVSNGFDPVYVKRVKLDERSNEVELPVNVINGSYYTELLAEISKAAQNKQGILVANDRTEAKALAELLNQNKIPGIVAEVITCDTAPANSRKESDILGRFKSKQTTLLISVNKLDEGLNLHDTEVYIDLTDSPAAKLFLQRVGRGTRLSPNKTEIQVYLMSRFTRPELIKALTATGVWEGGSSERKKKYYDTDDEVVVSGFDFLEAMRRYNLEVVDFWETGSGDEEDSKVDIQSFFDDVIDRVPSFYSGYSTRPTEWFRDQILQHMISKDQNILELPHLLGTLNVNQHLFRFSSDSTRSSVHLRIHKTLLKCANLLGYELVDTDTLSYKQLVEWGIVTPMLSDENLKVFADEIIPKSEFIFDGSFYNLGKWFLSRARLLNPDPKSLQKFEKLLQILEIKKQVLRGQISDLNLRKIHRAFELLSDHAGIPVEPGQLITLKKLVDTHLIDAVNLDPGLDEIELFKKEVIIENAKILKGLTTNSKGWFSRQLDNALVGELERAKFWKHYQLMQIANASFSNASTSLAVTRKIHRIFLHLAEAVGVTLRPGQAVDLAVLHEWGFIRDASTLLSTKDLQTFEEDVLEHRRFIFSGYIKRPSQWFMDRAKSLVKIKDKRKELLKKLEDLEIPETAFNKSILPSIKQKLHDAFYYILKAMDAELAPGEPITLQLLIDYGIIDDPFQN